MTKVGDRFVVNSRDIVSEMIEGEVIAIDLAGGAYYSLRGAAADVWQLLVATPANIDAVVAQFEDGCDREALSRLLDRLREERLIVSADAGEDRPPAGEGGRIAYSEPLVEKYEDMQDYFLIDPIHDVGAAGWPRPAAESPK